MTPFNVEQVGQVVTITVVGTNEVVGTVIGGGVGEWDWTAKDADGSILGTFSLRTEATEFVCSRWEMHGRYDPASIHALAIELHLIRGHRSLLRRRWNWLCDCNRDASHLAKTKWLRAVINRGGVHGS